MFEVSPWVLSFLGSGFNVIYYGVRPWANKSGSGFVNIVEPVKLKSNLDPCKQIKPDPEKPIA